MIIYKCKTGCTECNSYNLSASPVRGICTICDTSNYVLLGEDCFPKISNCNTYNTLDGDCTDCDEPYEPAGNGDTCVKDCTTPHGSNCTDCNAANCTAC